MTANYSDLSTYFDPLSSSDRRELEQRAERHRDRLEAAGYEVAVAEGEHGFFAGVLVIDEANDQYGFLEPDGTVAWITADPTGVGTLGDAVAQNPTEELRPDDDALENVDVE
jgi:hypothetical protein